MKLAEHFTCQCVYGTACRPAIRRGERGAWTFPVRKSLFPAVNFRWSMQNETDRKRVLKHISDCLGKRAWGIEKGSVASLWRSGTAGRISKLLMNSWRRSAHSQWRTVFQMPPPPHPPPHPVLSVFYTTNNNKNPKCTVLHLSVFQCEHCLTKRTSARWVKLSGVTKPYFYRARELWTDWVHGVSSQLTDTKLQTKR